MTTKAKFYQGGFVELEGEFIEGYKDALFFSNSSYIHVPNVNDLMESEHDITIEAIITPQSSSSNGAEEIVVGFNGWHNGLIYDANNQWIKAQWHYTNSTGGVVKDTPALSLPFNTTSHVAITYEASTRTTRIYKDGVLGVTFVSPRDSTHTFRPYSGDMKIGGMYTTAHGYNYCGNVKDVKIWNVLRTAQEISSNIGKDTSGQTGLLGHWKCDDTYSSSLTDYSGRNRHGVFNGAVQRVNTEPLSVNESAFCINGELIEGRADGVLNHSFDKQGNLRLIGSLSDKASNALSFNGIDSYVSMPNILPSSYTKEAWIFCSSSSGSKNIISSSGAHHALWIAGEILKSMHVNSSGAFVEVLDASPITLNKWVHVAVTYNATTTTMILYKNGAEVARRTDVPNLLGNGIHIGRYNSGSTFVGSMKDVRIWNVARTSQEINSNKSKILSGNETGLIGYWRFDEKTGNVAKDKTLNNNHGTIIGATRIFE